MADGHFKLVKLACIGEISND